MFVATISPESLHGFDLQIRAAIRRQKFMQAKFVAPV
jgi:hypothetical protein